MPFTSSRHNNVQKGFTLIELMIVVAIIAVLTMLALPQVSGFFAKSQITESMSLANSLKTTAVLNKQQGSCFSGSNNAATSADTLVGKYGTATIINSSQASLGCAISFTFNEKASGSLSGKKIVFNISDNGTLSNDASTTVAAKFLPKALL